MITWRELGFNTAVEREGHESYDSLPGGARETLQGLEDDPRPWLYEMDGPYGEPDGWSGAVGDTGKTGEEGRCRHS